MSVLFKSLPGKSATLCGEPVLSAGEAFEGEPAIAASHDALELILILRASDANLRPRQGFCGEGIHDNSANAPGLWGRCGSLRLCPSHQGQQNWREHACKFHDLPTPTTLASTFACPFGTRVT